MTKPDPAERRIREVAAFDNTAHADDIRELLAEYDHRGTALTARDVALRHAVEENERLHAALTGERRTRQQLWNILGRPDGVGLDAELLDAVADLHEERDRLRRDVAGVTAVIGERDAYRAALTELRAASRGLAFFDQIKCAHWNAAFEQAGKVLGMEDET